MSRLASVVNPALDGGRNHHARPGDATRRRIIAAARKVLVSKGYARATIEDITAAAGVSRATLYQHFDSKYALLAVATEKMRAEAIEGARQLADILISGDRAELRRWVEWLLGWYARNRPMALAGEKPRSARTSRRR